MEHNCFTGSCSFLLYSEVNRLLAYTYPSPRGHPHPPIPTSGSSQSTELSSLGYPEGDTAFTSRRTLLLPFLIHQNGGRAVQPSLSVVPLAAVFFLKAGCSAPMKGDKLLYFFAWKQSCTTLCPNYKLLFSWGKTVLPLYVSLTILFCSNSLHVNIFEAAEVGGKLLYLFLLSLSNS